MVMNNITDPFFEFPLSYQNFILYLDNKYKDQGAAIDRTGSQYAALTVNTDPGGYRAIITTTDNQGNATTRKFFIDESVYNSDQYTESSKQIDDMTYYQTKEQLSIYDYELELNEAKRQIKLLRKEYVSQFESELKKLMSLNYV
jgi:Tfp pilus tip-associated adhesin PilY1